MACNCKKNTTCNCDYNINTVGECIVSRLNFDGEVRSDLNWTETSFTETLFIGDDKPEIEMIDQAYATLVIDCIKLVETPFAYKSYSLYYLTQGVLDEIDDVITIISGGALTTITNALAAVTAVLATVRGILLVPFPVLAATVQTLIDDLNAANAAVGNAATALINIMQLSNPPANLVCEALQNLITALANLIDVVNTIIPTIEYILTQVTPAIAGLIGIATAGLQVLIDTLLASINVLLTPLLEIDCNSGDAFELTGNTEKTCLSGRKLLVKGTLKQNIVYTANLDGRPVYAAICDVPYMVYIVVYESFVGLTGPQELVVYDTDTNTSKVIYGYEYDPSFGITVNLDEIFNVEACIEDIYVKALETKVIFKNITSIFKATPTTSEQCG